MEHVFENHMLFEETKPETSQPKPEMSQTKPETPQPKPDPVVKENVADKNKC